MLTPGPYNSAYYEHCFLADEMGVEVVEGADLFVTDKVVYMRTTAGPKRVDVIYRRIDDEFLDPDASAPTAWSACPGLMEAYRAGNVALANAPGGGIADDKAIYPYVPEMVRFYLGEEPLLANVPTFLCERDEDLQIRPVEHRQAGGEAGQGLRRLRHADRPACDQGARCEEFRARILARPGDYIAQPTLALSTCPTVRRAGHRAAPCRPPALRALGQGDPHRPRRADPRGAEATARWW